LGFYNAENRYAIEAGEFSLTVGASSEGGLSDTFLISGN